MTSPVPELTSTGASPVPEVTPIEPEATSAETKNGFASTRSDSDRTRSGFAFTQKWRYLRAGSWLLSSKFLLPRAFPSRLSCSLSFLVGLEMPSKNYGVGTPKTTQVHREELSRLSTNFARVPHLHPFCLKRIPRYFLFCPFLSFSILL